MSKTESAKMGQGWQEISVGGVILDGGSSLEVDTGEWRTMIPVWLEDKCRHCFLCFPTCADSSIPIDNDKRLDFDFKHCKGCGVCYKVCPFGAITFEKEGK